MEPKSSDRRRAAEVCGRDVSRQISMETTPQRVADAPLPELRLVLLGRKGAGKSSAARTILDETGGSEPGKPTEESTKRRADVWGRRVTVVDTPGWEWYYPLNSTPGWVRRETLRGAALCPPGPHALLLVVRSFAAVTGAFLGQIAEHLEPLGPGVWGHTLVLFTHGDELGPASVEQRMRAGGGRGLRELLGKCGGRYHVLDNRARGEGAQVRELLCKTEEMAQKAGYFGAGGAVPSGPGEDWDCRAEERRRKQRHVEEQMQREAIRASLSGEGGQESPEPNRTRSLPRKQRRLPELRLLLLGERETGKSSVGNAILGGAGFFRTGAVTEESVGRHAEAGGPSGRLVTVVDTPGWEAGVAGPTPERVRREMLAGALLCPPGPHAVLLTLRVDTEVRAAPVQEHLGPLGEGVWSHTLLLFTHGDQLREGVAIEQHLSSGGRDLRWLLEKCGGRYHVMGGAGGGGVGGGTEGTTPVSTQVAELLEKVERMAAGNQCEAFSSLVQEVGDLSRQRSEAFERRLEELRDKARRRESELRRLREAEAKGGRWFFDRRRKIKSPARADASAKEEEEDEDRRSDDGKCGTGEAEERMRWLLEDKERELQELSAEQDRALAELHRSGNKRQEAALKLQQREAEIQELKERVEEQQLRLLDLQQAGLEMEQERSRWDEVRDRQQTEWATEVKALAARTEQREREKAELSSQVEALRAEMAALRQNHEDACIQMEKEGQRRARETEEAMAEMQHLHKTDMEKRIQENENEVEKMRAEAQRASQAEHATLDKMQRQEKDTEKRLKEMVDQIRAQHQKEIRGKTEEWDVKMASLELKHKEEVARKAREQETLMESQRAEHREETERKLKERDQHFQGEKQRELEELEKRMQRNLEEGEKERQALEKHFAIRMQEQARDADKEKESLRLTHEMQLGQKLQEKESHLVELERQHTETVHKLQRHLQDNDEFIINANKEMEQRLEENQRELEQMKRRMAELEDTLEKSEKDKLAGKMNERHNHKELEELRRRAGEMADELQRKGEEALRVALGQKATEAQGLAEREQEVQEIKLQMGAELIGKLQEKESEMAQKLQTKEREIDKIKQQMLAELNQKLLEKESEMARKLDEREQEVEEIKLQMEAELMKKLQEKESEMMQKLQAREREIEEIKQQMETEFNGKLQEKESEMAQKREEKEQEVEEIKVQMGAELIKKLEEKESELTQKLQAREREIEEIKQQMKTEFNGKLQEKESEMAQKREEKEQEVEEIKVQMGAELIKKLEEKESELPQKLQAREREIEEIKQQMKTEFNGKLQEKESEMAQKREEKQQEVEEIKVQMETEFNRKLQEKESEVEEVRQQAAGRESKWTSDQRERDERGEKEMHRLLGLVAEKTQEAEQMRQGLEEVRRTHAGLLGDLERLEERHRHAAASAMETQRRHDEALRDKDAELAGLRDRNGTQEGEIAHLRQTIEMTKSDLKALTGQMEREMTRMIHEYETEVARKNTEIESLAREKEAAADLLRHARDTSELRICDVTEAYEQRLAEMHASSDRIAKEMEDIKGQQREERDLQHVAERALRRSAEEQLRELSARYQEAAESKEATVRSALEEHRGEADTLEELCSELRREIRRLTEDGRECAERESKARAREEHLDRGREELEKRSRELDAAEEGVRRHEGELRRREEELSMREAELEVQRREDLDSRRVAASREEALRREEEVARLRTQNVSAKERELDCLLEELEHKQKELNDHGLDLQTKVGELKAWGKELEGREDHLQKREQELLNWGADLEAQCQALSAKRQQLHHIGQNLSKAQEELEGRKRLSKEMSEWQNGLDLEHMENGDCEVEGNGPVSQRSNNTTHREAPRDGHGSVGVSDQKLVAADGQEERENEEEVGEEWIESETASSATENKRQRPQTTDNSSAGQGAMGEEGAEPSRTSSPPSPGGVGARRGRSELRVLVLGEARSARYSTCLTVLGVDCGAARSPWCGELAGRRVALAEPLGLRWRDGPPATAAAALRQRERVLGGVAAFPGRRPHVVLLAVPAYVACTPAFRRAAEADVGVLGEATWARVVLLLTWGEALGESAEQHVRRCGDLQALVERCGRRYHVMAAGQSHGSLVEGLVDKMEEVAALSHDGQAAMGGEL